MKRMNVNIKHFLRVYVKWSSCFFLFTCISCKIHVGIFSRKFYVIFFSSNDSHDNEQWFWKRQWHVNWQKSEVYDLSYLSNQCANYRGMITIWAENFQCLQCLILIGISITLTSFFSIYRSNKQSNKQSLECFAIFLFTNKLLK